MAEVGKNTALLYNSSITIENIPSEVMAFEVSGRPALQWVVDYQKVKVDKASGIRKDPNATLHFFKLRSFHRAYRAG